LPEEPATCTPSLCVSPEDCAGNGAVWTLPPKSVNVAVRGAPVASFQKAK
jgi:hypothetical protein